MCLRMGLGAISDWLILKEFQKKMSWSRLEPEHSHSVCTDLTDRWDKSYAVLKHINPYLF